MTQIDDDEYIDDNENDEKSSLPIKYDIELDLNIINAIVMSKDEVATMSHLRYNSTGINAKLEQHLDNLKKWGMVQDQKPEGFGKARKISLTKTHSECISILTKIKNAIETVNEYLD